jgi:anthraniloyl-CoA monooxygenase
VRAPDVEDGLPEAAGRLAALTKRAGPEPSRPVLAAVHSGTPLTRVRLCEEARLRLGLPALLVDPALDRDQAVTVVLSGRADLVGVEDEVVRQWRAEGAA